MTEAELKALLHRVREKSTSLEEAVRLLKRGPFHTSASDDATPDHHRRLRHGMCESVLGSSKSAEQIIAIASDLSKAGGPVLITRIDAEKLERLRDAFPAGRTNERAMTLLINAPSPKGVEGKEPHVAIVSAGTSDLPVANEAGEVCVATETPFRFITDVGIAGLHRILNRFDDLDAAAALVVVAGMDGALPSVVGGLVGKPIFAVPTSIGYGANFHGLAPLLTMLNSCAPGVSVVNIDNGFGAGYAACRVVAQISVVSGE